LTPSALEDGAEELSLKDMDSKSSKAASWPKYPEHLTKLDGNLSRYNADLAGEDCHWADLRWKYWLVRN